LEVRGWRLEARGERLEARWCCGVAVRPRGQAKVKAKVEKERVLRCCGAAVEIGGHRLEAVLPNFSGRLRLWATVFSQH
jgi:hypothetical protein